MKNLENKSDLNICAADLLFENKMYNPSIHCAYYGAFQLTMLAVCLKNNFDLNTLKVKAEGKSSHNFTISEFFKSYRESNRLIAVDVKRNITAAKQYRLKADYDSEDVSKEDTIRHIILIKDTINQIKKVI